MPSQSSTQLPVVRLADGQDHRIVHLRESDRLGGETTAAWGRAALRAPRQGGALRGRVGRGARERRSRRVRGCVTGVDVRQRRTPRESRPDASRCPRISPATSHQRRPDVARDVPGTALRCPPYTYAHEPPARDPAQSPGYATAGTSSSLAPIRRAALRPFAATGDVVAGEREARAAACSRRSPRTRPRGPVGLVPDPDGAGRPRRRFHFFHAGRWRLSALRA